MPGISRRRLIAGAGAGAGALAVGGHMDIASAAPTGAAASTGPVAASLGPAAIVPGLEYQMINPWVFLPVDFGGTTNHVGDGSIYSSVGLTCGLNLPLGARLQQIEMLGHFTAAGSIGFSLYRINNDAGATFQQVGAVTSVTASGAGTFSGVQTLDEAITESATYEIVTGATSAAAAIRCLKLGFVPPYRRIAQIAPNRIYNTRDTVGLTKIDSNEERVVDLSSVVPAGATAAIINITTTGQEGAGYLALFQDGITWPGNSSINFIANADVANSAIVTVSTARKIKLRGGVAKTHVILDVTGYLI